MMPWSEAEGQYGWFDSEQLDVIKNSLSTAQIMYDVVQYGSCFFC